MRLFFGLVCIVLFAGSCSVLDSVGKSDGKKADESTSATKVESYDKIIPKDAITIRGLFTVHKVGDKR